MIMVCLVGMGTQKWICKLRQIVRTGSSMLFWKKLNRECNGRMALRVLGVVTYRVCALL
ncbi:hypothetical protein EES39_12920 [Streptomyces sp. ADI92-24]|nr:hypothetical protein EES39_12920 [Streptomyces sp. ADI92-24]